MVRVLTSLLVVCLVAATGVRPVVVAPEQRSTLKVARAGDRLHARIAEGAPGRVASHASGASGAGRLSRAPGAAGLEVPALAPASRPAFAPPTARITGPSAREPLVVASRPISTRSARGPPVV